ncbi:hypothetical protein EG329_011476 [Mollisiaceae sp. DMI_Dod_QoI]|nr:hypothetical protein EG329_011476 [Helotiales sp. DMI_Dod_QoI]
MAGARQARAQWNLIILALIPTLIFYCFNLKSDYELASNEYQPIICQFFDGLTNCQLESFDPIDSIEVIEDEKEITKANIRSTELVLDSADTREEANSNQNNNGKKEFCRCLKNSAAIIKLASDHANLLDSISSKKASADEIYLRMRAHYVSHPDYSQKLSAIHRGHDEFFNDEFFNIVMSNAHQFDNGLKRFSNQSILLLQNASEYIKIHHLLSISPVWIGMSEKIAEVLQISPLHASGITLKKSELGQLGFSDDNIFWQFLDISTSDYLKTLSAPKYWRMQLLPHRKAFIARAENKKQASELFEENVQVLSRYYRGMPKLERLEKNIIMQMQKLYHDLNSLDVTEGEILVFDHFFLSLDQLKIKKRNIGFP